MAERRATPIVTSRLVLEPVTLDLARAVVSGRVSGIPTGAGWPHADTADAMAMALTADAGPSWIVTVGGIVIGDCGGFSWPDDRGAVEIGYGVAKPFRGTGYATEAVGAMCRWLFLEADATVITATAAEADNVPSRRVLEKLHFTQVDDSGSHVSYRLEPAGTTGRLRGYRPSAAGSPCGSQACHS